MPVLRTRLLLMSLLVGCFLSSVLELAMSKMRIGAWFPPYWPGWFLAIVAAIVGHGEHWDDRVFITIATIGNAVFYAWIVSLALNADVESRGPIGRHFLR